MATRPGAPVVCRLCRRPAATRQVVFRQNVGVILLRFTKKVEGPLCRPCIESTFSGMTLTTFFAGWWGLISFFATPFILLSNILEYTNATRSPELRNVPSSAKGRNAIVAMAALTALAVVGGFTVVVAALALVATTPSRSRQAGRGADGGADGLREAEAKILAYQGTAAFGNTKEAERYAAVYSEKMALVRRIAFTGGRDESAPSLTEGRFLTYCEVRQGKVCFLVHVPETAALRLERAVGAGRDGVGGRSAGGRVPSRSRHAASRSRPPRRSPLRRGDDGAGAGRDAAGRRRSGAARGLLHRSARRRADRSDEAASARDSRTHPRAHACAVAR